MNQHIVQLLRRLGSAKPLSLVIVMAATFVVSCGGSSSSEEQEVIAAQLAGVVIDAITGAPLNNVMVSSSNDPALSTVTAPDGSWQIGPVQPSDDQFRFALPGFREELLLRPSLGDPIPQVALIPEDNAGIGGLSGSVVNLNGEALAGVLLNFIAGINFTEGTPAGSTNTNNDGTWSIAGLPYGNYTCIIIIPGLEPIVEFVQILGGINRPLPAVVASTDLVLPPTQTIEGIGFEEVRITLNWDSNADLRHVLIRDDGSEITRSSPEFTSGEIEFVQASGEAPQTSSITMQRNFLNGLSYSVVTTSGGVGLGLGTEIGFQSAEVVVNDASGVLNTYAADTSIGRRWDVFSFENGATVSIDSVN